MSDIIHNHTVAVADPHRGGRVPTTEEAEAILLLVRAGWLRLELSLDD